MAQFDCKSSKVFLQGLRWGWEACCRNISLMLVPCFEYWKAKRNIHVTIQGMRMSISEKRPYPTKPVLYMSCSHKTSSKKDSRSTMWFDINDYDYEALFKRLLLFLVSAMILVHVPSSCIPRNLNLSTV